MKYLVRLSIALTLMSLLFGLPAAATGRADNQFNSRAPKGPGPMGAAWPRVGVPDPLTTIDWTLSFTDVAPSMGAAAPGYGTAAAWGDYDGDGDQDLYIVNLGPGGGGQANILLRNDGATFTDVTAGAGVGDGGPGVAAAWADFDNDGDLDLFVSNRPGNNALFQNQGDGTFQNIGVEAGVGDSAGYGEGSAWADEDGDGLVDLYVANYSGASGQPNRLFRNLDGFHFADVAAQRQVAHYGNGEGIAWADFDNDGDMDLYIANAGGTNVLYQRQGDGTFDDVTAQMHVPGGPGSSYGAAWGDYDNDGWLDLYLAQQGTNKLYRNLGGTDFADVTDQAGVGGDRWGLGCAWGDYDNDGDLDLHVANSRFADPADVLYRNNGSPDYDFSDVTAAEGVTNTLDARGNAWADYDGDGDLDLYVVNQGTTEQPNRLFRNDGYGNHWLGVHLAGCVSNRSAIGARVVVTGAGAQIREISGGSGFASQDSLPAEFGLGGWSGPVDVTVNWPSGLQSALAGVTADRYITISEPCLDLSLAAKAASSDTARPREALTYTIVVPNTGDFASPAQVTDTLPLSVTWADALTATFGTPAWDPAEGNVLWSGAISGGAAVTISYRVTINSGLADGATITNVATVDDGYRPPFDTPPVTITVVVPCRPVTETSFTWTPLTPTVGEVVTFTASATGTAPITYTWEWGVGRLGVGSWRLEDRGWKVEVGERITHVYTMAGAYTVTLTASNLCGEEVVSETVTVEPACQEVTGTTLAWTPVTPTVGEVVTFTGVASGTAPITYTWELGVGRLGMGPSVTQVYTVAGEYLVTLTATNVCGEEVVSETVTVEPACQEVTGTTLAWTPVTPTVGEVVTFTGMASGTAPITYTWELGAGRLGVGSWRLEDRGWKVEVGERITHVYTMAGAYTVTMTATNACGEEVVSGAVTVEPACEEVTGTTLAWTPVTPTVGEVVTFTGSATGTEPITYTWGSGSRELGVGGRITHVYTVAGAYQVILTATNACGSAVEKVRIDVVAPVFRIYLPLVARAG